MVDSKQQWKAWLYLSPAIVLLLVFTAWPIINTLRMAFLENYSGLQEIGGATFNFGIGNFLTVIKYKKFLQCLFVKIVSCYHLRDIGWHFHLNNNSDGIFYSITQMDCTINLTIR